MAPRFVIVMAGFLCANWIERSIRSALDQEYDDFRVTFIDDFSADRTLALAEELTRTHPRGHALGVAMAQGHKGMLFNHVEMIRQAEDDEIIVLLDADDQLSGPEVLQRLAREYEDPKVWATYGSYAYDLESRGPGDSGLGIARQVPPEDHTRRSGWCSAHLKTFRRWLFDYIDPADFMFMGEWIDAAPDLALMWPIIELAGAAHARFIPDVLYLYNHVSPLNEAKIKPGWVNVINKHLLSQPPYPVLAARGEPLGPRS